MSRISSAKLLKNYSIEEEKALYKIWMKDYREGNTTFNRFFNNFCMYLPLAKGSELNRPKVITFNIEKKYSEIFDKKTNNSNLYYNQTGRNFFETIDEVLKKNHVYNYIVNMENPYRNKDKIMKATLKSYFDLRRMGYNRYPDLIV